MKDKTKYFLTRVATVAAAALLVYGYIKLPTDGLEYYHGSYSVSDKQTAQAPDNDVSPTILDKDNNENLSLNDEASVITPDRDIADEPDDVPQDEDSETAKKEDTTGGEEVWDENIELISLTKKVIAGRTASIKIKGSPNTKYTIYVYYSSGASKAKGLEPVTSNSNGYAEWSWRVGARTKPGTYRIEITDGSITVKTSFEVS